MGRQPQPGDSGSEGQGLLGWYSGTGSDVWRRCVLGDSFCEYQQDRKAVHQGEKLIRFERLVRDGAVADYAEIALLGHVTRAWVTQIMNLLNLAPDIQEQILFLPLTTKGRDPIGERDLRPIVAVPDWRRQRRMWDKLKTRAGQRSRNLPPRAIRAPSNGKNGAAPIMFHRSRIKTLGRGKVPVETEVTV